MEELDRRAQILDAAFEEFSEKGFKGATIKSIARAAGLQSPALIYWYFPDKEAPFGRFWVTGSLCCALFGTRRFGPATGAGTADDRAGTFRPSTILQLNGWCG